MKFYNREKEIKNLRQIEESSKNGAKMSIIIGRRRIGKTTLIKEVYQDRVYLFVSKKNEALLCEEFIEIIEESLDIKVFGTIDRFSELFAYLMELSTKRHFTLVIDEFQEFLSINPTLYASMQNTWDGHKDRSQMNLILSGSIYSLMNKIFEDNY